MITLSQLNIRIFHAAAVCGVLASTAVFAAPIDIAVPRLSSAPLIDGHLSEWAAGGWQSIAVKPAIEDDKRNRTGELKVELQAGTAGDRIYVAARWPDKRENTKYKPWKWRGKKYKRGKDRDDMFALRFDMGGDYNECMIAEVNYLVDVWLWSAGRTNLRNLAQDMWHKVSVDYIEDAAEYEGASGKTIYIKKGPDQGDPIYINTRPNKKKHQGDSLPGIEWPDSGSGSLVDVKAKGIWSDGYWHLEMSRKLNTGSEDDAELKLGGHHLGAIAVFNQGFSEHKSTSETLRFKIAK